MEPTETVPIKKRAKLSMPDARIPCIIKSNNPYRTKDKLKTLWTLKAPSPSVEICELIFCHGLDYH